MDGLMMDQPLLVSSLLTHAERHHSQVEVVSARVEGDIHRQTLAELARRARRMAKALAALGVQPGDRVGTLAWNGHRHMELYYAISGSGAVLHTLNPRLHADQLVFIAQDAGDTVLCFDLNLLPLVEAISPRLGKVRHYVVMTDRKRMPASNALPGLLCYEDLLAAQDDRYEWPMLDERSASSLCYTSGTTGNPKGVLYSHRSTLLHALVAALPDGIDMSAREVVLPIVPMFHVNAWALPYIACMVGAKLVLPGAALDGRSLYTLMEREQVTTAAGVPTIWQGLLAYIESQGLKFSTLKRTIIGGSACPPAMMRTLQETYGVSVCHAWGMTETSPMGVSCALRPRHGGLSTKERYAVQAKQGRAVFGVDIKIVGECANELPWDGKTTGELHVRGPWVIARYFGLDASPLADGWFPTGDVGTIDAEGYFQITDRSKDVIKSGGEWISSMEIENIAMAHPGVAMAACIGVPDERWTERPLLVAVKKAGAEVSSDDLLAFFEGKVAKWWIPDDVRFVDKIPVGATGKMLKTQLRERFSPLDVL